MKLQLPSHEIWKSKYQLKDKSGNAVDIDIPDTFKRVSSALAAPENDGAKWEKEFFWAMENGALPAGRIISNAGSGEHKPSASLINCTVMADIPDSMEGIMTVLKDAALTLKAGCGTGYCFSTLRPRNAYVSGAGATTSGPIPFMNIFDKMCFTVSSAGGRRGAQMGTFSIDHPDVVEFIKAKREDGVLRNFNLSSLVTDEFMETLGNDGVWQFRFPASKNDLELFPGECYEVKGVKYRKCGTIRAKELWDVIMRSNYEFAEPGILFIDRINGMNPLNFKEKISATNPCGEQPLPANGSCLLGSIDLTRFIIDPFSPAASFDWNKFSKVVSIFSRMLDNVVEIANLPLKPLTDELVEKRRHGMGFLGLGSAMTMLNMKYGSINSQRFVEKVLAIMVVEGFRTGLELAKEKGSCPALKSEAARKKYVKSAYFEQVIEKLPDESMKAQMRDILKGIDEHGCRYTHHTSIAPTGTLAFSFGNNASNGIEPSFSHHYTRNVIKQGEKTKQSVDVYSAEAIYYAEAKGVSMDEAVKHLDGLKTDTNSLKPQDHIAIQAAAQKFVDSSISKTINVPTEISFEDFADIYLMAYREGLKGCTTYRFNAAVSQGVLVRKEDAAKTVYVFTTEEGKEIRIRGDEEVEYEGHVSTAANLYDALNGGLHGKF
jgi:ribonucleoside-diphosphate reductase alpha chain